MADDGPAQPAERARRETRGWCSLRLRFDDGELRLLRAAEQVQGAHLARQARADALRTAIALAKAGHKIGSARAGTPVALAESELKLLLEAVDFAVAEVRWASDQGEQAADRASRERRGDLERAFPELVGSAWRGFALGRSLDGLAGKLNQALQGR